jgi:very-short-patch-repair endonuclease
MDEFLDPGALGFTRQAAGTLHVDGMKCFPAMLDVEADGVHHSARAGDRIRHRFLVADVRTDRLKQRVIAAEQHAAPIRVSGCDPHGTPMLTQAADDPAT